MKNVNYILRHGNSKPEKKSASLLEFFSEQLLSFIFLAGIVPPYSVLEDICNKTNEFKKLNKNQKIDWKPFDLSNEDYLNLIPLLMNKKSLSIEEIPSYVKNSYDWYLWQFEYKYHVPYKEHEILYKELLEKKNNLDKAIKNGNSNEITLLHLDYIKAGQKITKFLDSYLIP